MVALSRLVCLVALSWPVLLHAQRLPKLEPGTMIRGTTSAGDRFEGPLAEIRGDTLHLATTPEHAERAIALAGVRKLAYGDGTRTYGLEGAAIGAGIGIVIAVLAGRGEDGDWRVFSSQAGRNVMMLLGGGIGGAMGRGTSSPRWVETMPPLSQHRMVARSPTLVVMRLRF